jgi:hypothetical protein
MTFLATASGLMMERVRSIAMLEFSLFDVLKTEFDKSEAGYFNRSKGFPLRSGEAFALN